MTDHDAPAFSAARDGNVGCCMRAHAHAATTFALVELVRSVADFILAPVMLGIARVASGGGTHPSAVGLHTALWITLLITLAATAAGTLLYVLGGVGLPKPDIEAWITKNRPAIRSPLLAETLREEV